MSPSDPLRLLGKTLAGHFLVESVVGEGRFSLVYRGVHVGPKKPVALKCYKFGQALDNTTAEPFLRRFREENKVSAQASKESAVFVRSIGSGMTTTEDGGHVPYTVLEWLDGRSLSVELAERRARKERARSLPEVVSLLGPSAQAIAAMHDAGLAHGDLCPSSFFLLHGPEGRSGGASVKVLDFGATRAIVQLARELELGLPTPRIFSPAYAAPEHFDRALGEIGPRTDVYSFAKVLLEALSERGAFGEDAGRDAVETMKQPSPRGFGIPVSDAVEEAFGKALSLLPADRFPHVREFWETLEHSARERPSAARIAIPKAPTSSATMVGVGAPAPPLPPPPSSRQKLPPPRTAAPTPAPAVATASGPSPAARVPVPRARPRPADERPSSPMPVAASLGASPSGGFKAAPPAPPSGKLPSAPVARPRAPQAPPQPAPPPPQLGPRFAQAVQGIPAPASLRRETPMASIETLERPALPSIQRDSPTEPFVIAQIATQTPQTPTAGTGPDFDKTVPDMRPLRTPPDDVPIDIEEAPVEDEPVKEVSAPEAARAVPEMLPPPKTNVQVDGLPSVIVDDPEQQQEMMLRKRATVRLGARGANPWNHGAPAAAAPPAPHAPAHAPTPANLPPPSERTYSSAPTAVLPRTARRRRGLLTVAVISFLVVFVTGAIVLGVHWYLSTSEEGGSLPGLFGR